MHVLANINIGCNLHFRAGNPFSDVLFGLVLRPSHQVINDIGCPPGFLVIVVGRGLHASRLPAFP